MNTTLKKIDHKKELKRLYQPSSTSISEVTVPAMRFLMIDGQGNPEVSGQFGRAIEALYPLAYALKFQSKGRSGQDFVVMPLEGLWWADDMDVFRQDRRSEWKWTLMIMQPDCVSEGMFAEAVDQVRKKKAPELLEEVRFETYEEGECVQILHVGSFDQEGPVIERLHARIEELGKSPRLKHHEIYLSDPRRTPPNKLKTVLRQPMG